MTSEPGGQQHSRLAFFRTLAVLSSGHIVSKLLGFVVFPVLARTLDRDGYGAVEYLVGLSVVFATVVEAGLGAVAIRRLAHEAGALPRLAAQVPLARLMLALVSVPAMVLVAGSARLRPDTQGLVWLFALSLLPAACRQDWLLQATGRMRDVAVAQSLRMIVFAGIVLALVHGSERLVLVGWAEIAAVLTLTLYTLAMRQRWVTPWRWRVPAQGFLALAREGVVLGVGNILWAANQYAPLLLVATFAGADQTAWFAGASRITGSLLTFPYLYFFGLYPAIARGTARDEENLQLTLAMSFRVAAWTGTLVALGLTLLASPLCILVFGSGFGPSGPMLATMAWVVPIELLSGHARWSLVAAGVQSRIVYAQLAGTIAIAGLGLLLIPIAGGLGAALASVAASLAVWVVAHALATRDAARPPAIGPALGAGLLALAVVVATWAVGLQGWAAGVGALLFAGSAPLLDRRLLGDLSRLGASRPSTSSSSHD